MINTIVTNLGIVNLILCGIAMVLVICGLQHVAVVVYALASATSLVCGLGCLSWTFFNKER